MDGWGDEATVRCPPPPGCSDREPDFLFRLDRHPGPQGGTRRETTPQRDAIERGEKRFNAFGCK